MPANKQTRSPTRAPHGAPEFTERISFYCTSTQKNKFDSHGGSIWLRLVLDQATIPAIIRENPQLRVSPSTHRPSTVAE